MKRRLNFKGFSLIELLIVVGLIAALSIMVVIGIAKLQTNAKRQQTALTLENLRAMYAEYDTALRPRFAASALPAPMNVKLDVNPADTGLPLPPADDTTYFNRYGAAVWGTRDMMALLKQMPANATAIGKLPPSSLMLMPSRFNAAYPSPYSTGVVAYNALTPYVAMSYANDPGMTANPSFCSIGYLDPVTGASVTTVYRSTAGTTLSPNVGNQPPNTLYWMPVTSDDTVPIPLDAWGNPILFVAGGTLGVAFSPTNDLVPSPQPMHTGTGLILIGGNLRTVSSPDGRPFFASAGPDGDFSQGDDNIYSFEK